MKSETIQQRARGAVKQFSVFAPNRMGRLHEVIGLLSAHEVHVLAVAVVDTTDSAIIRLVVDDPDQAQSLLVHRNVPFIESELVVVELAFATELNRLMSALIEAELNICYLYSFIPHPQGKSLLALSVEDNDMAVKVLTSHQFRVLQQADISR
jgi:hypothetical protein